MKKTLILFLVFTMLFGISGASFAAEGDTLVLDVVQVPGDGWHTATAILTTTEPGDVSCHFLFYINGEPISSSDAGAPSTEPRPMTFGGWAYPNFNNPPLNVPGDYIITVTAEYAGLTLTSNPVTVTVGGTPVTEYAVNVFINPTDSGTVTGGGNYEEGSQVALIATANPGYKFTYWTENGVIVRRRPTFGFTMGTTDRDLTANFKAVKPKPEKPGKP